MADNFENTTGHCLCGQNKYIISGEISSFYFCHCSRCQRNTGSAFASTIFVKNYTFDWEGNTDNSKVYAHPNCQFSKRFCLNCGSPLPTQVASAKLLAVPAGSIDKSDYAKPTAHIFTKYRKSWEDKLIDVPKHSEFGR